MLVYLGQGEVSEKKIKKKGGKKKERKNGKKKVNETENYRVLL